MQWTATHVPSWSVPATVLSSRFVCSIGCWLSNLFPSPLHAALRRSFSSALQLSRTRDSAVAVVLCSCALLSEDFRRLRLFSPVKSPLFFSAVYWIILALASGSLLPPDTFHTEHERFDSRLGYCRRLFCHVWRFRPQQCFLPCLLT